MAMVRRERNAGDVEKLYTDDGGGGGADCGRKLFFNDWW